MTSPGDSGARETWPLWEVFIRSSRGLSHVHAGSLHAPEIFMDKGVQFSGSCTIAPLED